MALKVNINKVKYRRQAHHLNRRRRSERRTKPILPQRNKRHPAAKGTFLQPPPKTATFPTIVRPTTKSNPFADIFDSIPAPKNGRRPSSAYRPWPPRLSIDAIFKDLSRRNAAIFCKAFS